MKSYRSIKELVIDVYNSDGKMPNYEKLTALVREHFPNSKWQKSHYTWYKSQIKTGRLPLANGQSPDDNEDKIEDEVEDSLETRLSIERDLHNYLSHYLTRLEPNLTLHDGGVEYQTEAGRVDILAVDKEKNLVVVEVKAGKAKDSALGQLLGYMGCLSTRNKGVRGILVASDFDERVVFGSADCPTFGWSNTLSASALGTSHNNSLNTAAQKHAPVSFFVMRHEAARPIVVS